jgi:hypothetical protein
LELDKAVSSDNESELDEKEDNVASGDDTMTESRDKIVFVLSLELLLGLKYMRHLM